MDPPAAAPIRPPRPAWCPQCAADYAGDSAVCPTCGHDAGGELVLFAALVDPALRRRRRARWTGLLLGMIALAAAVQLWVPVEFARVLAVLAAAFAGVMLIPLLSRWWLLSPTARREGSQVRYGPIGIATRRGPGPVAWRPWRAPAHFSLERLGNGTIRVPALLSPVRPPPGTSPGRAAALVRAFQADATGVARVARVDEITHCPDCGYLLVVPRELPRPGRCPECGWAFGEQTLVLYGRPGASFAAARAHGRSWGWLVRDKLLLVGAVLALGVALVLFVDGVDFASRRLPPAVQDVILGAFLTALAVGLLRVWRDPFDERGRRNRLAAAQLKPLGAHQLRLTPDGFAQRRPTFGTSAFHGPAALAGWTGVTWRVTRTVIKSDMTLGRPPQTVGTVRLMVGRVPQNALGRWRQRLGLARRPVDFMFPADRRAARELRRRLRGWASAGEHQRGSRQPLAANVMARARTSDR